MIFKLVLNLLFPDSKYLRKITGFSAGKDLLLTGRFLKGSFNQIIMPFDRNNTVPESVKKSFPKNLIDDLWTMSLLFPDCKQLR